MATATAAPLDPVTIAPPLMTIEEFATRPDPGHPEELVEGRVVSMPPPQSRHGQVCSKVDRILGNHAEESNLGHVLSNDSGVITQRDPDTLRGADVCFYRYERVPKGPLPSGYIEVPPDLIIEVRSPEDRQRDILRKVWEYLAADVRVVGVLDPERRFLDLYEGETHRRLQEDDDFSLPDLLGDLCVPVRRFLD